LDTYPGLRTAGADLQEEGVERILIVDEQPRLDEFAVARVKNQRAPLVERLVGAG
jgi:hypothetical protein